MEQAILSDSAIATLAEAMSQSQAQFSMTDLGILLCLFVMSSIALWKYIIQPMRGKTNGTLDINKANEAHGVVTDKDPRTRAYTILQTPQIMEKMQQSFDKLSKSMEQLANHNTDLLKEMTNEIRKR